MTAGPKSPSFRSLSIQSVKFVSYSDGTPTELSLADAARTLKSDYGLRLFCSVSDWRQKPEEYEEFLNGDAHQALLFENQPLIFGYSHAGYSLMVQERTAGRTYARTQAEILQFLRSTPYASRLFSGLEEATHFALSFAHVEDVKTFIEESSDHLDFVIRAIDMASGFYFELGAEGEAQKARILALNDKAEAVLQFSFGKVPQFRADLLVDYEKGFSQLEKSLTKICDFAKQNSLTNRASSFFQSLEILTSPTHVEPTALWQKAGKNPDHYRLFKASVTADNFAGVESWNDVEVQQGQTFHRLSNELVLCLLEGVCASCS
jgi:hypothetical protein